MTVIKYISWWELRRLLFNGFLLGGSVILCLVFGFNPFSSEPGSGEYLLFISYLILIVPANLVYTLIYCLYYKKVQEQRLREILFKRMSLTAIILLVLYTLFILMVLPGSMH